MPGHIYLQLGDYSTTASTNEAAAAADRKYMASTGSQGIYSAMYYTYNLHFIAVARAAQGRYTAAKNAADEMALNVAPMLKEMPMLEAFAVIPLLVEIQVAKWDAIVKRPQPARESALYPLWLYGRVLALSAKGSMDEAALAQLALANVAANTPPDVPYGTTNTVKPVMELAAQAGAAVLAEARHEDNITKWRDAVDLYDKLLCDEPPAWYYPVRQSYGGALLRAGRAADAETAFREALVRNPRDGRLLFGLLEALKAQKKPGVEAVQREFNAAWKGAEIRLTVAGL